MKLKKLEAARGFAALYVVAHHAAPHSFMVLGVKAGVLFRFGQEAVMLFFLLSGFVIHYSYSKTPTDPISFVSNRFLRIFVPLVPALIFSYVVVSISNGRLVDPNVATLCANLLMLQDMSSLKPGVLASPYMGNSPLWSLSYEWWFYMIYILLVTLFGDFGKRTAVVIALGIVGALLYGWCPNWIVRIAFYLSIWWSGVM